MWWHFSPELSQDALALKRPEALPIIALKLKEGGIDLSHRRAAGPSTVLRAQ
jgi:hypothetical protein